MDELSPLGVFLVRRDANGHRLLFKYPYQPPKDPRAKSRPKNHYAIEETEENFFQSRSLCTGDVLDGNYVTISDEALANLFACQNGLCHQKFELKVNNVRFVGHPVMVNSSHESKSNQGESQDPSPMLNVVFALKAQASHEIVQQYHDLSKKIATTICKEETLQKYFTEQCRAMLLILDNEGNDSDVSNEEEVRPCAFEKILKDSDLAKVLRQAFVALCTSGALYLRINDRNLIPFCVVHKTHKLSNASSQSHADVLRKSMDQISQHIKPYHALLLVLTPEELLKQLSSEYRRALERLIKCASATKNMIELGYDTDIVLETVLELAFPLVYFAHAIVIFPIKPTNRYVIAPNAPTSLQHSLVTEFSKKFENFSLASVLAEFSLPTSLSQLYSPQLHEPSHMQTLQDIVVWCLQKRILMQVHLYVYLVLPHNSPENPLSWPSGNSTSNEPRDTSLRPGVEPKETHEDIYSDTPVVWRSMDPEQRKLIEQLDAFNDPQDQSLFLKLLPFFDGKNHIEHMIYCENITRTRLMSLLEKFQDILITVEHADPAFDIFYR